MEMIIATILGQGTQQRNDTTQLSYVEPARYQQTEFYILLIVALLVVGLTGYALFRKK